MFAKRNTEIEEQGMQDLTDEQLGQITGGSLSGNMFNVLSTVTGTATGIVNSVSVSGIQVSAAGVNMSTPALSTNDLLSNLL